MAYFDALRWHLNNALAGEMASILALVMFASGVAGLWSFFYQLRIRRWPSVTGDWLEGGVESFGAEEIRPTDRDYIIKACYHYTVDGVRYEGRRFSPWVVVTTANLKSILDKQFKKVSSNAAFEVFYNPRQPAKSFLVKPGVVGLIATLLYVVAFVYVPWVIWKDLT